MAAPIAAFFRAAGARDEAALASLFGPDARLYDNGAEQRVASWLCGLCRAVALRPIKAAPSRDTVIVTTAPRAGAAGHAVFSFTLASGKIAALAVRDDPGPELPDAIAAFVRATNAGDLEALLATFTDDALVNDQLRERWGRAAIAEWAARDVIALRLSLHVERAVLRDENTVVQAIVDGDFDKRGLPDPLVMTFYFSTRAGRIVQLLILRNETDE